MGECPFACPPTPPPSHPLLCSFLFIDTNGAHAAVLSECRTTSVRTPRLESHLLCLPPLCDAMQSAELRQKVALGEECLQEALNEALSLREEITKRTQHGEILLARIRFLKVWCLVQASEMCSEFGFHGMLFRFHVSICADPVVGCTFVGRTERRVLLLPVAKSRIRREWRA